MVSKTHLAFLKKFKKNLSQKIPIQEMYLFGSRAYGKPKRWSDFDVLIVSKAFKKKRTFERAIGFHHPWSIDYPVDFLCFTPGEFQKLKKQITIVREADTKGVRI